MLPGAVSAAVATTGIGKPVDGRTRAANDSPIALTSGLSCTAIEVVRVISNGAPVPMTSEAGAGTTCGLVTIVVGTAGAGAAGLGVLGTVWHAVATISPDTASASDPLLLPKSFFKSLSEDTSPGKYAGMASAYTNRPFIRGGLWKWREQGVAEISA